MRAGSLDRVIRIQRLVERLDGAGQAIEEYVDVEEEWAEFRPVNGTESFVSQQRFATVTHRFRIRWREDLDERCRIVFEGRAFDVVEALEVGRRHGLDVLATASAAADRTG